MDDPALQRRIQEAKRLARRHGRDISADPGVAEAMQRYRESIHRTQDGMDRTGVAAHCARCAGEDHGSCCFHGIEDGYGISLLLVNLLMGCDIPEEMELEGSCLFVGARGCKLKARYYFCLHYLCPALQESLGPEGAAGLLRILGEELQAGWEAEMTLLKWLSAHGIDVESF